MKIKTIVILSILFITPSQALCFSSKISKLDKNFQKEMTSKNIHKSNCPLSLDRLKTVNFSYYDFEGTTHHDGTIVVMDAVAEHVVNIFKELYQLKFPINKSKPMEHYNGNDDLSLADNNSSCFNCREMTGGSSLPSIHAYGLAIDINPIQNPYVGTDKDKAIVLPSTGLAYLNRANIRPGMVEPIVNIFKKNGFRIWGGKWNDPIDWQHFQTPRIIARIMTAMKSEDSKTFFSLYAKTPQLFDKIPYDNEELIYLYNKSPKKFMVALERNLTKLSSLEPAEAISFFKERLDP